MHVHTYYSDGIFSPKEVVEKAVQLGLDGIAITDHDTVLGVKEAIDASKEYPNFSVIPGIEFSCIHEDEEVHILGYFINYESLELEKILDKLNSARRNRTGKIVAKLNQLGMDIEEKDVLEIGKKNFTGRVHVAKALIKKGYVSSVEEAFEKYLERGQPAYVERESLSINKAIRLINSLGGVSILAHPGLLKKRDKIIKYCIDAGILGLECIHSKHRKEDVEGLKRIVQENNLIATGGSDCHGRKIDGEILLGRYYCDLNKIPEMKGRL